MICLGIEATAHTFGIGIVKEEKGKKIIIANEKSSYSTEKGGIVPNEAAEHHEKVKEIILKRSLKKAKENEIKLQDIDVIAYSAGPGLPPCLLKGAKFAAQLAKTTKKALVPVNHCIAHLEIGQVTNSRDPVLLYVSGANTQVISYSAGYYRIFGETLDIGVGNFIDAFARYCKIGFPGGPRIAELAKKSRNFIELPYSVKGMDVSFSGLLTNLKQKYDSGYKLEDLAFSLQEHAFAMLIEVSERAMAHLNKKELLLGGGVACNERLQEMARIMCKERKAKFFCPPADLLVDNGAMIAWLGLSMFKAGIKTKKAEIFPFQRTDEIEVRWK